MGADADTAVVLCHGGQPLQHLVELAECPLAFVDCDLPLDEQVAAWAHAVDIDGAKPHYHKIATELYYVLDGEGSVMLDGEEREVRKGSMVHIPPGVVHGAVGKMRVLVVGIPDIDDSDVYYV